MPEFCSAIWFVGISVEHLRIFWRESSACYDFPHSPHVAENASWTCFHNIYPYRLRQSGMIQKLLDFPELCTVSPLFMFPPTLLFVVSTLPCVESEALIPIFLKRSFKRNCNSSSSWEEFLVIDRLFEIEGAYKGQRIKRKKGRSAASTAHPPLRGRGVPRKIYYSQIDRSKRIDHWH